MLKGLGCAIIMLAATLMGCVKYKKLSNRVTFLTEYLQFINYLEAEIRYSSGIIQELIEKYSSSSIFNNFLLHIKQNMSAGQTLNSSWISALSSMKDSFGLYAENVELIYNFGNNLGNSDIESQISYCKMNKQLVRSKISLAREDKEKKGQLYFLLYFFAGLSTVLFFL